VLLRPETRELFTSVQRTAIAAVSGDETEIVAVVPVNVTVPVTCTAIGSMLEKNMEPRQFPLLVEEGAVHQIQKPNCAGPEHVVFLQEKELGSALALKTIPGEAVDFAAAAACEAIRNAAIAPKKSIVTKFRRVAIVESPPGFRFWTLSVNRTLCDLRSNGMPSILIMSTHMSKMSPQNENVRFVQSRNVRFHGWPRACALKTLVF
jgi:hypothetical protein